MSVGRVGERWDRGRDLLSVAQLFVMGSITDYILNYFILSPFTSQTITECILDKCQARCELDTAGLMLQDVPNAVYMTSQPDAENAK